MLFKFCTVFVITDNLILCSQEAVFYDNSQHIMSSSLSSKRQFEGGPSCKSKRKGGVQNQHIYKRKVQKRWRLYEQKYVSTSTDKTVPAKSNTNDSYNCKLNSTNSFSPEQKKFCLSNLYCRWNKNEQDAFLMGLIQ